MAGRAPAGPDPTEGVFAMTACIPDDPAYCFYPHADEDCGPPHLLSHG